MQKNENQVNVGKKNDTNKIIGDYGYAIKANNKWLVIGASSEQTYDGEFVYNIGEDTTLFDRLAPDAPVYASVSDFNDEPITHTFVTKGTLLDDCRQFLALYGVTPTTQSLTDLAINVLTYCDWQDIESFIFDELEDHIDPKYYADNAQGGVNDEL